MHENYVEIFFVIFYVFKSFFKQTNKLFAVGKSAGDVFRIGYTVQQIVLDFAYKLIYVLIVHIKSGAVYICDLAYIRNGKPF